MKAFSLRSFAANSTAGFGINAMLQTDQGALRRRNEFLQSVNGLLWGGNVDLLTVDGVRTVDGGMLFPSDGLRIRDVTNCSRSRRKETLISSNRPAVS